MASKGYRNLWIMAIGLIAVFVVATVIAPQIMGRDKSAGDGWNTDMPSGEAIFQAPTTTLSASGLKANEVVDFSVYASPVADTTGKGGIYAWIFQLEGAGGRTDVADIRYNGGSDSIVWSQRPNGVLWGVGPRFVQGPGAASVDVSSSLSMAIADASSDYTLKIWIATASNVRDIDPMNYTSVSPMVKIVITMDKTTSSSISVDQVMSVPSNITEGEWNRFTVTSVATAMGRWSEPIATYIGIEKDGINASDVSVRINTGSGYSYPAAIEDGDELIILMVTKTPFTGRDNSGPVSWNTTFEINFATAGDYVLTSWAENANTGEDVTAHRTTDTLAVKSAAGPEPEPEPEPEPGPDPEPGPGGSGSNNSSSGNQSQGQGSSGETDTSSDNDSDDVAAPGRNDGEEE